MPRRRVQGIPKRRGTLLCESSTSVNVSLQDIRGKREETPNRRVSKGSRGSIGPLNVPLAQDKGMLLLSRRGALPNYCESTIQMVSLEREGGPPWSPRFGFFWNAASSYPSISAPIHKKHQEKGFK
jgi:hypothetical protein